jgi:Hypothetical protein (DUF2513)
MKRDLDLMRDMMLWIEETGDGEAYVDFNSDKFKPYDPKQIREHVLLLSEAGYIGEWLDDDDGVSVLRLNNSGHDFLASIKDDDIWEKTKNSAQKIGSATLELTFGLAKEYAKQKAKSLFGIDVA